MAGFGQVNQSSNVSIQTNTDRQTPIEVPTASAVNPYAMCSQRTICCFMEQQTKFSAKAPTQLEVNNLYFGNTPTLTPAEMV